MNVVQKIRVTCIPKWFCSDFVEIPLISSKFRFSPIWSFQIFKIPRRFSVKSTAQTEKPKPEDSCVSAANNGDKKFRMGSVIRREAQQALLDYFYGTRNILFMDAENMSNNSPHFLENLLLKIDIEADIGRSITRFLRYHPINEFEPFFESSGLTPVEYGPLLPRDLMFLCDDKLLLKNHKVLCYYGIARSKIGKIYKEATEVFRYGNGVLLLKLKAYEDMGLSQSFLCKVMVCSPNLLIGDVNMKFIEVLGILKSLGIEINWIEEQLSEESSYNWNTILEVLSLFSENGFGYEELREVLIKHPGLIFFSSGDLTLTLVGVQVKFGSSMNEICSIFHRFPQIEVEEFVYNFRRCTQFLLEIKLNAGEIGDIIRSHPTLLGTCSLKKPSSIYTHLNAGKKRLRKFILENPQDLTKLVVGSTFGPLTKSEEELKSNAMRTKFIVELGYEENSDSMNKALKLFEGRGSELQERFDCLVKAGLDKKDVCEIVRLSPQILSNSVDTLLMKIDFLVNELGYPISTLVTFPTYLNYACKRIKLRLSMYNWLIDQGIAEPMLAMTTLIHISEKTFIDRYVKRHSKGPQVWHDLKQQIYPE